MAGRSLSHARAQAELERIRAASDTPTPQRQHPIPYDPALNDEAIALADIGMTGAELAAHWCISEETMMGWSEAHPDFKEALQRARTRAKAWWQRQPRLAIREKDNKFPAGAWSQQVRALFSEYADQSGPTIHIDLGRMVVIHRRDPQQLTGDQLPRLDKSLIHQASVQHQPSWTVPEQASEPPEVNLVPHGEARPAPASEGRPSGQTPPPREKPGG
ncbi:hypothetical protein IWC96_14480 [Brevundimonas sp. BAL450]|uniref:hypothetical protein n=1 Tax=Brevundimonas sp. BAL450 TaxID=1708162 RepID=UPI0018CB54B6|nr:hypothetical protein [Brevundimonas sp. BAL450]MBG7616481.1 hypothetical protein [Brevundimonas sp. BAL450]